MEDSWSKETEVGVELYEEVVGDLDYSTPILLDLPVLIAMRKTGQPLLHSKDPSHTPVRARWLVPTLDLSLPSRGPLWDLHAL